MSTVFAPQQPLAAHENWDDDFEFHANSPPGATSHLPSSATRQSTTSTNAIDDWDRDEPTASTSAHAHHDQDRVPPGSGVSTRSRHSQPPPENWDDDFEDRFESPSKKTPSKRSHRKPSSSLQVEEPENWDDDFEEPASDDDDGELGFAEKDEDRTVTARSRRTAALHSTPPPPVPPIPFALVSQSDANVHERVFPRSPSASVFSAPSVGSGRDSVAFSYYHNNSTTHLRPTISRSTLGGLSNLPPSPPIHKERERRRLRKKSRPHPEAVYEMVDRQPSSDASRENEDHVPSETPPPPSTPPPSSASVAQAQALETPSGNRRHSVNLNFSPPILSRIGSVKKKWAIRKKRTSSTPSEVSLHEMDSNDVPALEDTRERTPRPPSSSGRPGWFFRVSNQGNQSNDQAQMSNGSGVPDDSPSKLVKRKSFGFVPIRKGKGPLNDGSAPQISSGDLPADLIAELDPSPRKKNRHLSQQVRRPSTQQSRVQSRHASYGGDSAAKISTESLALHRQRKRSVSRCSSRETNTTDQSEKEGRRGFMGSMRRISLVGKHQRTKSNASSNNIPPPPPLPQRAEGIEDHEADEPTGMKTPSKARSQALLPPIELQPPSPPRLPSLTQHPPLNLEPVFMPPKAHSQRSPSPGSKAPSSLGRAALPQNGSIVPRRNSLGDLKIPARISQAQVGLKRDLSLVRDFALEVEQLKDLQSSYNSMMSQIMLDVQLQAQSQSRAISPEPQDLSRPRSHRGRSNTGATATPSLFQPGYKQLATTFYTINSKYRIAWECAELLIELGSGSTATSPGSPPSTSISTPFMPNMTRSASAQSRDRIMDLLGDNIPSVPNAESTGLSRSTGPPLGSPPTLGWRASTGRHDLSQRQLMLLREMLNHPDSAFVGDEATPALPIPEEAARSTISVNQEWRWGDPIGSTVTLPSEDDTQLPVKRPSKLKSFRDMLRSLKKSSNSQNSPQPPVPISQTSLNTDSSVDSHPYHTEQNKTPGRRRAKTSSGPEAMPSNFDHPTSPYMALSKASPRRPSLASIFKIGQRHKSGSKTSGSSLGRDDMPSRSASRVSSSIADDEDWDRLDRPSDPEPFSPSARKEANSGTIRGLSPYLLAQQASAGGAEHAQPPASTSQTSLWAEMSARPIRLSNVEEVETDGNGGPTTTRTSGTPSRQPSRSRRGGKTGSVRSMPPQQPDAKLAMTPENIKPLLDNAREVHSRLKECISEISALLEEYHSNPI